MARTVACVVKDLLPDSHWRLGMLSTREIVLKPLQEWRRLGTGNGDQLSRREQIAECLYLLSGKGVDESPCLSPVEGGQPLKDDLESSLEGNFDGGSWRIMRESEVGTPQESERLQDSVPSVADSELVPSGGNMPVVPMERSSCSLSDASEFRNADSFISELEDASKNDECLESRDEKCQQKDNVDFAAAEAYQFQILHFDESGNREPVCIFDLPYNDKGAGEYELNFILIASPSELPISNYSRSIDSWTMRPDDKAQLLLYVREVNGTWYKLCTAAKSYRAVFDDCLMVIYFLELVMRWGSKFKNPHTYYTKMQKFFRVDKSKIRDALKRYYTSVIQKFLYKGGVPLLRDAPIMESMKKTLKVSSETPNVPLCKTFKSGVQRKIAVAIRTVCKRKRVMESYPDNIKESGGQKEIAPAKKCLSKRKRVVVSESEDEIDAGTDSEDLKPLLQRRFKRKKKGRSKPVSCPDDAMNICIGSEQDQRNLEGQEHGDNCPSRWRSDKILEVAEVREPEILKENLDVAEKSPENTMGSVEPAEGKIAVSKKNFQGADYADESAELRVLSETTGIYDSQVDMPEEFDSDDEEVGGAAFCAICDDGGDLLFCDGPCMRSFHASREAAAGSSESKCRSMGFTAEELKETGTWLCPNCDYKRHQCFICGNLGNSEGENKEVFLCDVALCGRFYHLECLGEFTNMSNREVSGFLKRIKDGTESVFCPAHKCLKCLRCEVEGGSDNSMKLANCRRCPKAYHKTCLPPSISFEGTDDEPVRAWEIGEEDDPVKRLVIYCTDHHIDEELNTPKRDHLKWPEEYRRKTGRRKEEISSANEYNLHNRARELGKQIRDPKEEHSGKATPVVPVRPKGIPTKPDVKRVVSKLLPATRVDDSHASEREQTVLSRTAHAVQKTSYSGKRAPLAVLTMPISRETLLKRIRELKEKSASIVTMENVHKSLFHPSCYVSNARVVRRGDLVSIINAAKKAGEKIEGGNFDDAKRICPRVNFLSLYRSEDALKIYLSPLLHGTRYTSYGRHFTNPDKLKEIIERIHWYIDDGDMVVDFCCGANDFSTLLKQKLDSVGKKCDYRNFDIHPPKNTFAFTKGDWFQTKGEGFAEGKKLVMGLNPPFGTKAALATKFVLHALNFKPKLLVLIVPPETMEGGRKYSDLNYSLVWEDRELLSGKSFYLPGSLDRTDDGNVSQWNNVAPPLFLWCPSEVLGKNQQIAAQQKHIRSLPQGLPDLHRVAIRDLQSDPSRMSATHRRPAELRVDILPARMQVTPTPSPTALRGFDLRASSGALPGRSKSPLSDSGFAVPPYLPPQISSSSDELSTPFSTPISTPQSSSSSHDGQIPGHLVDPHRNSFKKKLPSDGRGPGRGFAGHFVPRPGIVNEISSGLGHSDLHRKRMLIGMHGGDHATPSGRNPGHSRPGHSREGMVHPGVNVDHSGFVRSPATLMNLRLHGNLPVQGRTQFGVTPQGAPPYPHMPSNTPSFSRMQRNPPPQPPAPRPCSPSFPTGMQPCPPVHRNMQPGPGQPRWALGGLQPPPPPPPPLPAFVQSMHRGREPLPAHHGHGLQARPLMHPHIPVGRSGVSGLAPPLVNVGFSRGRGGEDNFGRVHGPMGGARMGGPSNLGSGGWIERED